MKLNKKALVLIDKGFSAKTLSKLDESQINVLHSKLIGEAVTQNITTSYNIPTSDLEKGAQVPTPPTGKKMVIQKTPTGIKATPTEEVTEEDEVTIDPNKETETQSAHQVGPSTDDGFGNEDDGMGMFEGAKKDSKTNPWAICTAQLGKEFGTRERHLWSAKEKNKYERCVKDVKQSLKEGKNPVSLFLENEIMKIVERNLPPRITKGDLVKFINEAEPAVAPPKTKPTTKPGTRPDTKPQKPGHPLKNPNPGEKPAPKAKKVSPEKAKEEVINTIMKLLKNG